MFSKLYQWYLKKERMPQELIALMFLFVLVSMGFAMGGPFEQKPQSEVLIWIGFEGTEGMFSLFALIVASLPLVVPCIDLGAAALSSYITHGDHSNVYPIGRFLFGEAYTKDKFNPEDRYYSLKQTFMTRLGGMLMLSGLVIAPLGILGAITIESPETIPFVVTILSIVGLTWGIAALARFAYGISKKLAAHKADPNAHQRNTTQTQTERQKETV